jgi:hypothetical protein
MPRASLAAPVPGPGHSPHPIRRRRWGERLSSIPVILFPLKMGSADWPLFGDRGNPGKGCRRCQGGKHFAGEIGKAAPDQDELAESHHFGWKR